VSAPASARPTRGGLRLAIGAAVLAAGGLGAASAISACSATPDTTRGTEIFAPDLASFKGPAGGGLGPSAFLERRCGTLDCHGQQGRPLRIYGFRGLRLADDAGNVPGGNVTTAAEQQANYNAVIGLEPEILSVVVAEDGGAPERLLLIKKPRLEEGHKGGRITVAGDDGDTCMTTWLAGVTNFTACANAATAFDQK
jgi:hypothetical protein